MSDLKPPRVQWTLFINSPKACTTAVVKCKVAEDEIKFTRTVAESIKEELTAKRVKESNTR